MKTVRIWFKKLGAARFISHLDLNRCMARAVHMAKIPLWYTQGFNPHAFITFALPLSLGVRGERECMDMKIDETKITDEELLLRLQKTLPEDLPVFAVTDPKEKPGKIAYALYELKMCSETPENAETDLFQKWESFLNQEKIPAEKRSKSGPLVVDLKPDLQIRKIFQDGETIYTEVLLPAGSEYNLNPSLLVETFRSQSGASFFCEYTRHCLYNKQMEPFQ